MNKKVKSLKIKIIMFLIPTCLVSFTVLSFLGYSFASNSLKKSNLNLMSEMAKTSAQRAEDKIESEIRNLEVLASNNEISNDNISLEEKGEILKKSLEATGILELSVSDKNGKSIDTLGKEKEIKTTQSFMKSIKGEKFITNPYIDPSTNKKVISYSVPIKDSSNNIIGVIVGIKDCRDFAQLNDEVVFLNTGSSLIVDGNGNFIVSKDESFVNENKNITNMSSDTGSLDELNNIGKSMTIGNQTGIGKYKYDSKVMYMAYNPIGETGLALGITVEEKDLLSALDSLSFIDVIVTALMTIIIFIMIIIFTIVIMNRLVGAKRYVDTIAKGDLYTEINKKYIKGNDEISQICSSVSQAKRSVKKMIKSVKSDSNTVKEGALALSEIAEKLSVLTEEISASMGEVSVITNRQSDDFIEITNKLDSFSQDIIEIKNNIHGINQDVEIINKKSLKGTNNMQKLNYAISNVNGSFKKFLTNMEYMKEDMNDVNKIIGIINGISEQINLLSLNAAIEAASAGEAGRGFNIIALEVKKLSDQSKESSQNIYKIIKKLTGIINNLVEQSNNIDNELNNQKNMVYNASSSFEEIALLVEEIVPKVSSIDVFFNNLNINNNIIVNTVYDLSKEISSTSKSLEQVTDSSVQLASLAQNVNCSSDVLLEKADDLIEKVKQFKIEELKEEDNIYLKENNELVQI